MSRTVKPATGTARYKDGKLQITTNVQRGKKTVKHTVIYAVEDVRPDPSVCSPAFSLTKETSGEVWHVGSNEFGVFCDCPHATYRGANSRVMCKHCAAMVAVGLFPPDQFGAETYV